MAHSRGSYETWSCCPETWPANDSWSLRSVSGIQCCCNTTCPFLQAGNPVVPVSQQPCWYQAVGQIPSSCPIRVIQAQQISWEEGGIISGPLHMPYLWLNSSFNPIAWIISPHYSSLNLNIFLSRNTSLTWWKSKDIHVLLQYYVMLLL